MMAANLLTIVVINKQDGIELRISRLMTLIELENITASLSGHWLTIHDKTLPHRTVQNRTVTYMSCPAK